MAERRLAHFNVRYDGEEHEAVGREILRALERHYATLASALDYEPTNTITVILFTKEGYYNASGAPAWSGGVYDNIDGRIRVPVGGLTSSLTPDMDQTLIHELTHAFVADRTRGHRARASCTKAWPSTWKASAWLAADAAAAHRARRRAHRRRRWASTSARCRSWST